MKDTDLLLTRRDVQAVRRRQTYSRRKPLRSWEEAVARAQAAKVLDALVHLLPHRDYRQVLDLSTGLAVCAQGCSPCALSNIINDTGLTWPPKEG